MIQGPIGQMESLGQEDPMIERLESEAEEVQLELVLALETGLILHLR